MPTTRSVGSPGGLALSSIDWPALLRKRGLLARDAGQFRLAQVKSAARVLKTVLLDKKTEPELVEGSDFGRLRWAPGQEVKVAESPEALRALFAQAQKEKRPIAFAGSRHSSNGQTLAPEGGLQIRVDRSSEAWAGPRMIEGGLVEVAAVHTWRTLQHFLRREGLTAPVLTDHLGTSIGGTLSVGGGIGTASIRSGRQLDSVEAFSLILPSGEEVWCSREENRALFRNAPGGLGQLGLIHRVRIRPLRYKPHLALFAYQAGSLAEATTLTHEVLGRAEEEGLFPSHFVLEGPVLNTPYVQLEFGFEHHLRSEAEEQVRAVPACLRPAWRNERWLRRGVIEADRSNERHSRSSAYVASFDGGVHLWNDWYFNTYQSQLAFVRHLEEELFPRFGNEHLMSGLSYVYRSDPEDPRVPERRRAAFSYPYTAEADLYRWSFGVVYSLPQGEVVDELKELLRLANEAAVALGGGLYPHGYTERSAAQIRASYGPIAAEFAALKRELDPDRLLGARALPPLDE